MVRRAFLIHLYLVPAGKAQATTKSYPVSDGSSTPNTPTTASCQPPPQPRRNVPLHSPTPNPSKKHVILSAADHSIIVICGVEGPREIQSHLNSQILSSEVFSPHQTLGTTSPKILSSPNPAQPKPPQQHTSGILTPCRELYLTQRKRNQAR